MNDFLGSLLQSRTFIWSHIILVIGCRTEHNKNSPDDRRLLLARKPTCCCCWSLRLFHFADGKYQSPNTSRLTRGRNQGHGKATAISTNQRGGVYYVVQKRNHGAASAAKLPTRATAACGHVPSFSHVPRPGVH